MTLKVGSLFDGIYGGGLGAEQAGMKVIWRSEIDPACNSLMEKHRPDIPNLGDVHNVGKETAEPVDVVIGGFPCQDLSVAGKRAGFAGERSGLWFEFHRVLAELRPEWAVIENVPGLLSSCGCIDCQTVRRIMRIHGWLRKRKGGEQCPVCKAGGRMLKSHRGRDFAVLLRGLVELGYGVSWRVFDAQYFGLAQRRKRVFIVGHLGDGAAAEVLFEREGGTRDTPPSRQTRQSTSATLKGGSGKRGYPDQSDGNGASLVAVPLTKGSSAKKGVNPPGRRQEDDINLIAYNIQNNDGGEHKRKDRPEGGMYVSETDTALTVGSTDMTAVVAQTLRSEGHDASEDGTGRQNLIVAAPLTARHSGESDKWPPINEADNLIAFDDRVITSPGNRSAVQGDVSPTLGGEGSVHVAAWQQNQRDEVRDMGDVAGSLVGEPGMHNQNFISQTTVVGAVSSKWAKGTGGPAGDEAYNLIAADLPVAPTLSTKNEVTSSSTTREKWMSDSARMVGAVRRLTPLECERLQGFPDGWTDEGASGKQSDSTRYRQLGNAWAVAVAAWIMKRIVAVSERKS